MNLPRKRSTHPIFRIWRMVVLVLAVTPGARAADIRPTPLDDAAPFRRFLWVTRWDYRTEQDIERICYNAASARFTDLLFQVRGEATVFFDSPYEPWAWELSGLGPRDGVGVDPGWDPLAIAIREGRRRGMRVHAYVNTLPCWAQDERPRPSSGQIYAAKPEWVMVDKRGKAMKPDGFYAFVDPGLPEVRRHLAALFGQLAQDYAIDGIHLDYIRYPHEAGDMSYHPAVLRRFKAETGQSPAQAPQSWSWFKREQLTATVREIRRAVEASRPGLEISAAIIADPETRTRLACQDPSRWLAEGLVDAVAPMIYVEDMGRYTELARPFAKPSIRDKVWLGVRAIPKNRVLLDEIALGAKLRVSGIAVFSYNSLFKGHKAGRTAVAVYETFTSASPVGRIGRIGGRFGGGYGSDASLGRKRAPLKPRIAGLKQRAPIEPD